jgi:hypothetical protein
VKVAGEALFGGCIILQVVFSSVEGRTCYDEISSKKMFWVTEDIILMTFLNRSHPEPKAVPHKSDLSSLTDFSLL